MNKEDKTALLLAVKYIELLGADFILVLAGDDEGFCATSKGLEQSKNLSKVNKIIETWRLKQCTKYQTTSKASLN
jgi:hypothetical protein